MTLEINNAVYFNSNRDFSHERVSENHLFFPADWFSKNNIGLLNKTVQRFILPPAQNTSLYNI